MTIEPKTPATPATPAADRRAYRELRRRAGAMGFPTVHHALDALERLTKAEAA